MPEMLVVAVLALLLFSPRELPKILRGVSQLWGSLRRTADEFRDAIMQEEAMQDLKEAVNGTKAQLRDAEGAARRELMKARMEARRAENKLLKVGRERERKEREAAAKAMAEGEGNGGEGDGAHGSGAAATPASEGPAPSGTIASGSSASSPSSTPAPSSKPAPSSEPPPKTVDPRHAAASSDDSNDSNAGAA